MNVGEAIKRLQEYPADLALWHRCQDGRRESVDVFELVSVPSFSIVGIFTAATASTVCFSMTSFAA